MKYYLAPLEGITSYIYRNVHHKYFHSFDKYFTPFIVPHPNKKFSAREKKELSAEHNRGLFVVPQLLTNQADDFIQTARDIMELGYEEINLNLGCPSGTVVAKRKGSGFLAYPEELDRFLNEIYRNLNCRISIKTRVGKENPKEFERLLQIYNQYPIHELIVHPRVQTDYYKNKPNWYVFQETVSNTSLPLCYNGDIFSPKDHDDFVAQFPTVDCMMLGRGIIANPGLLHEICKRESITKSLLFDFHKELYEAYKDVSDGDRNTLFKMKELWSYMKYLFDDYEKPIKRIKKAQTCRDYDLAVQRLFEERALK